MKLHQLLKPDLIKLDIQPDGRMEVIAALIDLLGQTGRLQDTVSVKEKVIQREREVGTGIGYGVAIPHTDPGPYSEPLLVLGRLSQGVDFHAPDKIPARLIFLLLTPDRTPTLHVRLLARICRLLKSERLRNRLLDADNPHSVIEAVSEAERELPELNP